MNRGRAIVLAVTALAALPVTPATARTLISTTIDPNARGVAVARDFLGFSLEYRSAVAALGTPATNYSPAFNGLVKGLQRPGLGSPLVRLGAASADDTWWNPTGLPRPEGIELDMTGSFIDSVAAMNRATGAPLILTLNAAAGSPRVAADMAGAFQARIRPSEIRAFEVGNEPDLYDDRPFGKGRARPKNWSVRRHVTELRRFITELRALRPVPRLAAPDACCIPAWDRGLPYILRRLAGQLSLITYHSYPLAACGGRKASVGRILAERSIQGQRGRFRPLLQVSKAFGRPLRITETHSVACATRKAIFGVVRTHATSLWSLDWMFLSAANGVAGLNFHLIGGSPFQIINRPATATTPAGPRAIAGPLYYAMQAFADAAAGRAKILVLPTLLAKKAKRANARVWVTKAADGDLRVVVINKSSRFDGDAVIRIARGRKPAGELVRLRSSSLTSNTGTSYAGRRVPNESYTGEMRGTKVKQRVRYRGGAYRFRVPRASAAVLTIQR